MKYRILVIFKDHSIINKQATTFNISKNFLRINNDNKHLLIVPMSNISSMEIEELPNAN